MTLDQDKLSRADTGSVSDKKEQMIIFIVGDQEYCIPIIRIKEIREFEKPTYLPHCLPYVEGAINIRGSIITVINLATYLGVDAHLNNERRVVIVIEKEQNVACGLLVDGVVGITDIYIKNVQPVSVDGGAPELRGLVTIGERVIRILKLDSVFARLSGQGALHAAELD